MKLILVNVEMFVETTDNVSDEVMRKELTRYLSDYEEHWDGKGPRGKTIRVKTVKKVEKI